MKDIDRVVAILDDVLVDCHRASYWGHELMHSQVVSVERRIREAKEILEDWPAKVYAVGVEPGDAGNATSEGGG